MEKSQINRKVFQGDKDFFKESDDQAMCLSMHQPWASLMVTGFKRFEGREWSTKYRGPLWIHSTSQKCSQAEIDALEDKYRKHYAAIGEDCPPFPERYINSCVIGRVDLVDVLPLQEYRDTVPDVLREDTVASYQFVIRNPMYLDLPLRMTGQPSIYKMDKTLAYGARPLLKKAEYTWWPPKEYASFNVGSFDIYPMHVDEKKLKK